MHLKFSYVKLFCKINLHMVKLCFQIPDVSGADFTSFQSCVPFIKPAQQVSLSRCLLPAGQAWKQSWFKGRERVGTPPSAGSGGGFLIHRHSFDQRTDSRSQVCSHPQLAQSRCSVTAAPHSCAACHHARAHAQGMRASRHLLNVPHSRHHEVPLILCTCEVLSPSPEETRLAGLRQPVWGRAAFGRPSAAHLCLHLAVGQDPSQQPRLCDAQLRGQPRT